MTPQSGTTQSGTTQSGRVEGGTHFFPLRVYFEDTDAGGIVYYANYLKFAERARTELLRLSGVNQSDLSREHRLALAVRSCSIDYLAPARLDDLLEVRSRLVGVGGATITAEQEIKRDGEILARLDVKVACVKLDGGPARLPRELRAILESYRTEH